MSPPPPRINTFINVNNSSVHIDNISKVFILTEFLVGINRTSVLGSTKTPLRVFFTFLAAGLVAAVYLFLLYKTISIISLVILQFFVAVDFIEYACCSIMCWILNKKILNFYLELNKFDKETGFQKNEAINKKYYIINFIHICITISLIITFHLQTPRHNVYVSCLWLLAKTCHCIEFNLFAHFFILIIPRLKCIYRHMATSYPEKYNTDKENKEGIGNVKKCLHVDIKKIMEFYNTIVLAFGYLNEAIRWQMLLMIMTTFSIILCFTFLIAKTMINNDFTTAGYMFNHITICIIELGPLLAPCVYAEDICREVRQLKDYLTTRVFDNTLDKSNRRSARAFLMLIEKRDLSFSLFDMFLIDISLPCKFTALWLTYLVMMLQFDKVVSGPK